MTTRIVSAAILALTIASAVVYAQTFVIAEKGVRWSAQSSPAAGSQATASAAATTGLKRVVDCITFSGESSGGAVTAAAGTVSVRDGASGAGTVLWPYAVAHAVAAGAGIQTIAPHTVCGLNLIGTANTAMTIEFDAGITNELQRVGISGYFSQ